MSIPKKILTGLIASSLVVPSITANLASANSEKPIPLAPKVLTVNSSNEALAKEILENGIISNEVVTENNTFEVPQGFTQFSNYSINDNTLITPFAVDPGGGSTYWDGSFQVNGSVSNSVMIMGLSYAAAFTAKRLRLSEELTATLLAAASLVGTTNITIKGTTYYKLISSTKAEYYSISSVYVNGKLIKTASGSWTAEIDPNTD
ncbi:hypothetical protein [Ureibacillus sinduriensis]|uniref:Surface layer protein A domain-containing protein n=1 Tax=Ureibacillus sinduriensis BLB-1 = JCM 15800 TaxID=1384057 RepID=A0A0A3HR92_9BACL|nr:hypothetical protein [Ureibacillus sinduriensis]KGR74909.1 hypothetical protein CD33_14260 [Ureibacillus sinduriensis BLB-1 = JCM 15800]